jgi:multicomponent Na+:H+ antiporter subunit G
MAEFLLAAAGFLLVTVALGLVRIVRGPGDADRMMSAQLLGTGGVAVLLLAGGATGPAGVDVALILALLAAFASVAFVKAPPARNRTPTRRRAAGASSRRLHRGCGVGRGFFFLAGSVGLLRFPDALSRLHALTKADNLGLGLVMLGLLPRAGSLLAALKLVFVWLLVLLASAMVSQLVARVARRGGAPL